MSSVRRNMAWMAASQASVFVSQFAATVVIARLLTPYEMGVFAAAVAVAGLLAVIRHMGLGSYVIRAGALTPAILETTFTVNVILSLMIAVMVAGLSVLGGVLLDEPGVRDVLLPIALVPLLSIIEFRPAVVLEHQGQFGRHAAVNMLRALVASALSVLLAYYGHSYMSLAYGQLAGGAVAAMGFSILGWRHASLRFGLADWRGVLRYGGHMLAISGTTAATMRLAELTLARLLGLVALGMYARAGGVANMIWENVYVIVSRVLLVDQAEQRRQGRSLRDGYLRVTTLMTALLWPVFAGLAVVSGPLLLGIYGPQWVEAQLPLSLLALSALPLVTMIAAGGVLVVTERTAEQARLEALRAVAGLSLFLAGCLFGLAWAAAARVVDSMLTYAIYRGLVQRMSDTCERDFVPIYLGSAALTGAAVGPAFAVMMWYEWSPLAPLGPLGAAMLAGVVLWTGLMFWMNHPLLGEARWLLDRLGSGKPARSE